MPCAIAAFITSVAVITVAKGEVATGVVLPLFMTKAPRAPTFVAATRAASSMNVLCDLHAFSKNDGANLAHVPAHQSVVELLLVHWGGCVARPARSATTESDSRPPGTYASRLPPPARGAALGRAKSPGNDTIAMGRGA